MKKNKILLACVSMSAIFLSGCNGGLNLTIPSRVVDSAPIVVNPSDPTDPTDPGENPTNGKNRIFVSSGLVTGINAQGGKFFDTVCAKDAEKAGLTGKFVALIAANSAAFATINTVNGYIYQKLEGAEVKVADNFKALIDGKNDKINANAFQHAIDNSYKNYAWTGQNNFNQPASSDLNCANWSTDHGYGIVGKVGATGSDALAVQYQPCNIIAHLYCLEVNN